MKTVAIFDQCGEEQILFIVFDGDKSHLDRVYINAASDKKQQKLQDELSSLLYDSETGEKKYKSQTKFPVKTVAAGAKVIVIGFLP